MDCQLGHLGTAALFLWGDKYSHILMNMPGKRIPLWGPHGTKKNPRWENKNVCYELETMKYFPRHVHVWEITPIGGRVVGLKVPFLS